jgi:transmembrane sensor
VSAAEIDDIAADWVARIEARELTPAERRQLDAWIGQNPRHEGALVRARAIWAALDRGRALASPYSPAMMEEEPAGGARTRRWAMGAVATAAAAMLVSVFCLRGPGARPRQRFATGTREIRTLLLSDGSRTVMNAASQARFAFDHRQRLVLLDHGEGWFDVAKDKARPFIVRAGEIEARAVGTAFAVARSDSSVDVTVTEGVVEIAAPQGRVRVVAGGRASIPFAGEMVVAAVTPAALDRDLAWREHRVILDGESLATAVEAFNRFNDRKILIEDPALAQEPVVGSFDLFAPDQFADAVSSAFSTSVTRRDGVIVLGAARSRA